ncbi:hypothetical protein IEQ34_025556 [Dendrobium chrysotoxum]|uniref:Uncharacterized protein n=1 Tax=Dendrobium chrysotoxum TaxID=161865 RepID=A0AAV7FQ72_DENCH|nr:hypothetical protein IEQ34_025556 [Dendrobium chrysotoxum]
MRQKIFFLKRFDSELLYVQGPILEEFQRFSLPLSVSTKQFEIPRLFQNRSESNSNDSKHFFFHYTISETQGLDRMDMISNPSRKRRETDTQLKVKVSKQNSILDLIDTYRILWKAVFDESRMYGLEGDFFISFEIHPGQKAKISDSFLALIKRKLILEPLSRSCHVEVLQKKKLQNPIQFIVID